MGLIFWWMLVIWVVGIAAYWLIRYLLHARRKREDESQYVPVAHSNRLTQLQEYVVALKLYRRFTTAIVVLLTTCLLSAIVLTARPATISVIKPAQQNRDIMLCLDDSGSVLREDTTLLDRYSTLVSSFSGQRFGLTLFDSSAVTIIPLNDNYQLITQRLKVAAQAFQAQKGATFTQLTNGTLAGFTEGTSLVSDGLASCILHMGTNIQNRSQSIILATDNEVNGKPVVGVAQAIVMAKQRNIHVFAIDPGVADSKLSADHAQLQVIAKETGGNYYTLDSPSTVDGIITAIRAQQAANYVGVPQLATNDNPAPFIYLAALLAMASIALLWRLEL
ncbi:MAG TPA: VWA domain-containing protein [Candidatus Saccharimonadia bacterium]|jgi:hypothetical protein